VDLTFETVRQVAGATYGQPGFSLADLWSLYNQRFFDGVLRPILIVRTRVFPYGHCVGMTVCRAGEDPLRHILVKTFSWPICHAQRAVLLHEMLHYYLFETKQDPKHAGQPWCDEVMRISRELGQPVWAGRYTAIRKGKTTRRGNQLPPEDLTELRRLTQREIAAWPGSIRLFPPPPEDLGYAQLRVTKAEKASEAAAKGTSP
jgi:hypothetical protein